MAEEPPPPTGTTSEESALNAAHDRDSDPDSEKNRGPKFTDRLQEFFEEVPTEVLQVYAVTPARAFINVVRERDREIFNNARLDLAEGYYKYVLNKKISGEVPERNLAIAVPELFQRYISKRESIVRFIIKRTLPKPEKDSPNIEAWKQETKRIRTLFADDTLTLARLADIAQETGATSVPEQRPGVSEPTPADVVIDQPTPEPETLPPAEPEISTAPQPTPDVVPPAPQQEVRKEEPFGSLKLEKLSPLAAPELKNAGSFDGTFKHDKRLDTHTSEKEYEIEEAEKKEEEVSEELDFSGFGELPKDKTMEELRQDATNDEPTMEFSRPRTDMSIEELLTSFHRAGSKDELHPLFTLRENFKSAQRLYKNHLAERQGRATRAGKEQKLDGKAVKLREAYLEARNDLMFAVARMLRPGAGFATTPEESNFKLAEAMHAFINAEQQEISGADSSFDAVFGILREPELVKAFGPAVLTHMDYQGPARPILEGVLNPGTDDLADALQDSKLMNEFNDAWIEGFCAHVRKVEKIKDGRSQDYRRNWFDRSDVLFSFNEGRYGYVDRYEKVLKDVASAIRKGGFDADTKKALFQELDAVQEHEANLENQIKMLHLDTKKRGMVLPLASALKRERPNLLRRGILGVFAEERISGDVGGEEERNIDEGFVLRQGVEPDDEGGVRALQSLIAGLPVRAHEALLHASKTPNDLSPERTAKAIASYLNLFDRNDVGDFFPEGAELRWVEGGENEGLWVMSDIGNAHFTDGEGRLLPDAAAQ